MHIYISGIGSFIGRELVRQCNEADIQCSGIDLVETGIPRSCVGDIADPGLVDTIPDDVTGIIHLAAISRDSDCQKDPMLAYRVNLMGTANLMEASKQKNIPQFVFASSEWVYGDVGNNTAQLESDQIDITKMTSEYAISKIVGERILSCGLKDTETALTILRFGIVYGTRTNNWSAVEAVFNSVRTKSDVKVGALKTGRRFIHVRDIVSGIIASLKAPESQILNLSGDRVVTLEEVIEVSQRILGKEVQVEEGDASSPSVRNPDNAVAKLRLDWVPEISLEQGLTELNQHLEQS